ncbi:MAG: hypothetical protein LQ337_007073 [Flavoplaca oasis]|nr:MAG: hypothetical protein LQ337_007073 [Flavoplaca oasis]
MTIVATAMPRITDEVHSLDQVGWYASAFLMTLASFQSSWGKAYKYLPLKWSFLASRSRKAAPPSLLDVRLLGSEGAGVLGGVYVVLAYIVSPPKQAAYLGLTGAVFSIASVAGSLLSGVLTDKHSWRWCFCIYLPADGVALLPFLFFFQTPSFAKRAPATYWDSFQ